MNVATVVTKVLWDNFVSKFVTPHSRVQIGANTYGNPKVITTHDGRVIIGKFCSIADDVLIIGDNHSYRKVANFPLTWWIENVKRIALKEPSSLVKGRKESPIIIGNDVWIGAGAIILPEVKIGNGAIIGAGAVVSHNVPAYAVVAGVPARILRFQFTPSQIEQLEKIAWWDWNEDKIIANIGKFYGEIDQFILDFAENQYKSKQKQNHISQN
jgi:acetyltransferase-like isoleucine patch superfamily enzyme